MINTLTQLDFNKTYSYADYLTWKFSERLEIWKGKINKLSPAPNTSHQRAASNLHGFLWSAFRKNPCQLFSAPFDVRILDQNKSTPDNEVFTVVQPDLCVLCDDSKIDKRGAFGAPDLVIEILSPGNSKKEMKFKFDLYQEAGVPEYWIVNPADRTVLRYVLRNGFFIGLHPLTDEDAIACESFSILDFDVCDIFD
jgi:Uma2 family endonuclease